MRRRLPNYLLSGFVCTQVMIASAIGASPTDSLEIRAGQASGRVASSQPIAMPSLGVDVSRMLLALVIVVGLIFLSRLILKRFYQGSVSPGGSKAVQVLNRTVLAPRQQILLLQVGRRVVVVGESNGNLSTLAQIDDADEIAQLVGKLDEQRTQRATAFGGLFGRAQKKLDDESADAGASPADREPEMHPAGETEQMRSELSSLLEKMKSIRGQIGRD